jgi:hypothetical protein
MHRCRRGEGRFPALKLNLVLHWVASMQRIALEVYSML